MMIGANIEEIQVTLFMGSFAKFTMFDKLQKFITQLYQLVSKLFIALFEQIDLYFEIVKVFFGGQMGESSQMSMLLNLV